MLTFEIKINGNLLAFCSAVNTNEMIDKLHTYRVRYIRMDRDFNIEFWVAHDRSKGAEELVKRILDNPQLAKELQKSS